MVKVGDSAPDFTLKGDDGKLHTVSENIGKKVVVYFYPKDNTPGCTVEACDFRDNMASLINKGAVVYGISRDNLVSHNSFKDKYHINFTLLSDIDAIAHEAYGTINEDGKIIRSTFLIDEKGKISHIWSPVTVDGHVKDVMSKM